MVWLLWQLKVSIDLWWEMWKLAFTAFSLQICWQKFYRNDLPNISFLSKPLNLIGCHGNWKANLRKYSKIISESIRGLKLKLCRNNISLYKSGVFLYPATQKVAGYYVIPSELWVSVSLSVHLSALRFRALTLLPFDIISFPEREVRGSKPTTAVLCPWARHFTPRKYWLITQEAMAPSRHDWKIVDWDVKPQHNQP